MPPTNVWEPLRLLRTNFDEYGKAQGIQIRWSRTDHGNLSFSYAFGLVLENENEDGSDLFKPFRYIPDRFVSAYITLLQEAAVIVQQAMEKSDKDDQGRLTASLLEVSVISNIKRKRIRPVVGNGR